MLSEAVMTEKYDFDIGEGGLDYDILDKTYSAMTQALMLKNGLKSGMHVLDVGSGAGVMTTWIAEQVGVNGSVTAIDNSPEQLTLVSKRASQLGLKNISTQVCSAYELTKLKREFDVIYCRFLLHHLYSPRKAINTFYEALKPGGIYFGQEGIIHSMWAYPDTFAWRGYEPIRQNPAISIEGEDRDGDFGMKLPLVCKQSGFTIKDCCLDQPILWTKQQKQGILAGLLAFKNTALEQGMTESDWQEKYKETLRIIDDPSQVIAFYSSCFIAAVK